MSNLRRSIIHAALTAGDDVLAEQLLVRRNVRMSRLRMYARHYGI